MSDKKVVFNILTSSIKGGIESMFIKYCQIIKELDYDLYCIAPKNSPYLAELKKLNIKIITLSISGNYDFIAALKLQYYIKKHKADLLIAHNGKSYSIINIIQKLFTNKKLKTLAFCHGGKAKRLMNFEYVITIAKHLKKKLQTKKFKNKLFLLENFIKAHKTTKKPIKKTKFWIFGIASRLAPEKNISSAIYALIALNKKYKINAKMIIAGEGVAKDNLIKLVQKNKQENNIKFIGWQNNLNDFFKKIDIFLLPSLNESFGLSILEAFNNHIPVISSKTDGAIEIIENNKTGFLYSIDNLNELISLMHKSYNSNLDSIKKNAYNDFIKNYEYKTAKKKLSNILKSL